MSEPGTGDVTGAERVYRALQYLRATRVKIDAARDATNRAVSMLIERQADASDGLAAMDDLNSATFALDNAEEILCGWAASRGSA